MQRWFDSYTHTRFSDDSTQSPEELYASAQECALSGFAITDHANLSIIEEDDTFRNIAASTLAAISLLMVSATAY